jgi:ParB family transcriptional regulator, chromosome partitioning protein
MAKNSKDAYGAVGTTSLLSFDPDTLVIVTDPKHPLFDERAALEPEESMILNVKTYGVIQAITVCKNRDTGAVEVVYGRQRVKALREANRRLREAGEQPKFIQAKVTKAEGPELAAMVVVENEIRKDDTPMNRARKMSRLMERYGFAEDQVAVVFGCSVPTVKSTLALLEVSTPVRTAVEDGTINVTTAAKLAKLPAAEQRAKLAEVVNAGQGKTGHEKSKAVRKVVDADAIRMRSRKECKAWYDRLAPGSVEAKVLNWVMGGAWS